MTNTLVRDAASNADTIARAAQDILDHGYAVVKLGEFGAGTLQTAIDTAVDFFHRPLEQKMTHGSADHNYGFRPFGIEYSISPDRPDMNECFTLWSSRLDLIPNRAGISELTGSFLDYRDTLVPLVEAILDTIAQHFGAAAAPAFEKAAHLQINYSIPAPPDRAYLQDKHEDGHMVTVLHANAPGLEIYDQGFDSTAVKGMLPGHDEVVIMPGSVLTALTGGAVQPLYHQVRNHALDNRQSIMYFVNPEIDEPLYSWVADADGEQVDLREQVRNAPSMFGLPDVEVL